jgi:hypothetical protein
MAKKVSRDSRTGQFTVVKEHGGMTVIEKTTGKRLPLKGYGALKGQYEVRKGVDVTKPIYEQSRGKGGDLSVGGKDGSHRSSNTVHDRPKKK